jgi:HK97 gp10 family phage protein
VASVTIKVEGLKELGQQFARLSDDMQKKVARSATNAAAQVVKKIAFRNAIRINRGEEEDTDGEFIADNIIVSRRRKVPANLTSQHIVTVRSKGKIKHKRRDASPYFVGVLNEHGTVKMSAWPFMRPAIDQGVSGAIEAMKKKIKERIDKANRGGK